MERTKEQGSFRSPYIQKYSETVFSKQDENSWNKVAVRSDLEVYRSCQADTVMANAMRDIMLSGTAGFLTSCAIGFTLHRAMWKAADEQAKQLDAIVGNQPIGPTSPKRQETESFERYIARRASQWWNKGVDNVHGRLLGLPNTVDRIVKDVKSAAKSKPSEQTD